MNKAVQLIGHKRLLSSAQGYMKLTEQCISLSLLIKQIKTSFLTVKISFNNFFQFLASFYGLVSGPDELVFHDLARIVLLFLGNHKMRI